MYGDDQYGLAALLSGISQQPEDETTAYSPQYQAMMQRFGGGAPAPQAPVMPQRPTLMARAGGGFEYGNAPVQQQQAYPQMLGTVPRGYTNEQQWPGDIPGLVRTLRGTQSGQETVPGMFFQRRPQEQTNLPPEMLQAMQMYPDIISETPKGVPIIRNEDRMKQQALRGQFTADMARINAGKYSPDQFENSMVVELLKPILAEGRPPTDSEIENAKRVAKTASQRSSQVDLSKQKKTEVPITKGSGKDQVTLDLMGSIKEQLRRENKTPFQLTPEMIPPFQERFGRQALESQVKPSMLRSLMNLSLLGPSMFFGLGPATGYEAMRGFGRARPGLGEIGRRAEGAPSDEDYMLEAIRKHINSGQ